ncbi:MAG: hypothetical protein IKR58_04950 [Lachnospiraceae bacterium]|nr:hypothetical protein [Lachnospiraceae bacterium]
MFSAWAILGWLFPFTLDDWYWGTVHYVFPAPDNGRYAGHLVSLILTRSRTVRMLAVAAAMTGIVYCIERMVKRPAAFVIASSSLLLLPKDVFRQAVAWASGFSNYTAPVPLFLLFGLYIMEHPGGYNRRKAVPMLLLLLGFINSLFVEHYTVFNIALSVGLLVFYACKQTVRTDYIGYCAGSILGAMLMFSNSVYQKVLNHTDTYRAIAYGGFFRRIWENYGKYIFRDGYLGNWFLNAVMLFSCLLLLRQIPGEKPGRLQKGVLGASLAGMYVFTALSVLSFLYYDYLNPFPKDDQIFWGILSLLALLCTVAASLILAFAEGPDWFSVILWAAFFALIAPLLIVYPIGGRCFLGSYVILIIIVCHLAGRISLPSWGAKVKKYALVCSAVAITVLFARYYYIFGWNYTVEIRRVEQARAEAEKGRKAVVISRLPYEDYLWWGTPFNEGWNAHFKKFYGLPEDLVITVGKG